jgi:2-polyprenyl-3-methyl-5-hydroxy-6-metoxy-1,4-benzoquinol methylase
MSNNIFSNTSDKIIETTTNSQERNRLWWESLPMTYAMWEDEKRQPTSLEDFQAINQLYLDSNPWLRDELDFSLFRDQSVLEIGCGAGSASTLFAGGGAKMTSVDITEQSVAMTKANAQSQGLDITVSQMDAEKLTFPNEIFDYVYSWGVIHHSNNPNQIMRQIYRVLKPGGRGLIMVYNKNSLRYYLKGLIWLLLKGKILQGHNLNSVQKFYTDGFYHRHYKANELSNDLRTVGLSAERISITHMSKKMIPLIPRGFDEFLKHHYGWLLVIEFRKQE